MINYNGVITKWAELGLQAKKSKQWTEAVRWAIKYAEEARNWKMVAGHLGELLVEHNIPGVEAHEMARDIMNIRNQLDARCELSAALASHSEGLKSSLATYGHGLTTVEMQNIKNLQSALESAEEQIRTPPHGRFQLR